VLFSRAPSIVNLIDGFLKISLSVRLLPVNDFLQYLMHFAFKEDVQ